MLLSGFPRRVAAEDLARRNLDLLVSLARCCSTGSGRLLEGPDLPPMDGVKLLLAPFRRADIADRRVKTDSIIEAFDVCEDISYGFCPGCISSMVDELCFQRVEKALHRGIVVAIAPAAHRGAEAGGCIRLGDTPPRHIERRDLNDGSVPRQDAG